VNNVTIMASDFNEYTQNEMFDFVYSVDVLEHIPDDYGFLVKIREKL